MKNAIQVLSVQSSEGNGFKDRNVHCYMLMIFIITHGRHLATFHQVSPCYWSTVLTFADT